MGGFSPLKPLPIKERHSFVWLELGRIDVVNGAFVFSPAEGEKIQVPIGAYTTVFLEPGTRISHASVCLAAKVGCLLVWTGEGGVRTYSAGQPGGSRSDRLLWQFRLATEEQAQLRIVRRMYSLRFGEEPPMRRSVAQLRGLEGSKVRSIYQDLAGQYGVVWSGRNYDTSDWDSSDLLNRCVSTATSCLYGLVEAAVLSAGYSPAIGFVHTGKPLSFVYDIADLYKFDTVVRVAFKVAAQGNPNPERAVRRACRDSFRQLKLLKRIVPEIHALLEAGGVPLQTDLLRGR